VAGNVAAPAASLVEWAPLLKDAMPECEAVRGFAENDLTVVRDEALALIRGSRPTRPCSTSWPARNAPAATRRQPRPILVTAAAEKINADKCILLAQSKEDISNGWKEDISIGV
jgi:hypothetical protein